ncbi:hypothetical protein FLLO111716_01160 [Flavobacterium longum]|uniref:hypothetical protein n=1 Tax=Flavobacterium longum TaxID=1299340 RepID=UPI0039E8EFB0
MKKLLLPVLACAMFGCSSDDGGSSNDGIINSADDVAGNWRMVGKYEHGSTTNTATPCNLQLSTLFFGENHLFTLKTGNTTTSGTCSTTTSSYDEYWILVGIVRIEQNSTNKQIYTAEMVDGHLQLTQTSYTNSSGFHDIEEADQKTLVYERYEN